MSSAALLSSDWTYNADLDVVSLSITGLEKHSKPGRVRSTLSVPNGPQELQVRTSIQF